MQLKQARKTFYESRIGQRYSRHDGLPTHVIMTTPASEAIGTVATSAMLTLTVILAARRMRNLWCDSALAKGIQVIHGSNRHILMRECQGWLPLSRQVPREAGLHVPNGRFKNCGSRREMPAVENAAGPSPSGCFMLAFPNVGREIRAKLGPQANRHTPLCVPRPGMSAKSMIPEHVQLLTLCALSA
jgi:hypothetical protein